MIKRGVAAVVRQLGAPEKPQRGAGCRGRAALFNWLEELRHGRESGEPARPHPLRLALQAPSYHRPSCRRTRRERADALAGGVFEHQLRLEAIPVSVDLEIGLAGVDDRICPRRLACRYGRLLEAMITFVVRVWERRMHRHDDDVGMLVQRLIQQLLA